jgi:MFS family permease
MSFWQQILNAAGPGFPLAVIVFVLGALVLFAIRPAERSRLRAALLLFAVSFVGLLALGALGFYGMSPVRPLYRWTKWASLFCAGVAFVNVASVFIFTVFLEALRLKPAHVMRELRRAKHLPAQQKSSTALPPTSPTTASVKHF